MICAANPAANPARTLHGCAHRPRCAHPFRKASFAGGSGGGRGGGDGGFFADRVAGFDGADGIVARARDTQDRRIVRVSLTDAGQQLNERLSTIAARNQEQLTSVFEPDELDRFEEYLDRIQVHAGALLQDRAEVAS